MPDDIDGKTRSVPSSLPVTSSSTGRLSGSESACASGPLTPGPRTPSASGHGSNPGPRTPSSAGSRTTSAAATGTVTSASNRRLTLMESPNIEA